MNDGYTYFLQFFQLINFPQIRIDKRRTECDMFMYLQ